MGDDGISCIFDQLSDDELMEDCGWVLDKEHDDLDQYQFGVTRKIINDRAPKANSKEEAMKLYNDNLDNCTEIEGDAFDRYDYKFHSIEENKCPIIESLRETL